jgi:beta-galactosidase
MLEAALVRDLAWVFLDGNPEPLGVMDTRYRRFRVDLPARDKPMTLELLVHTIARINFGQELHDRKGLRGPILFHPKNSDDAPLEIRDWEMRAIDFGADATLPELKWAGATPAAQRTPSFWRGEFRLAALGDTFLDMARWGTGIVWVNGHCLGRYWNIGPTQTMYLPAPWLKTGANEIIVLDLSGPEDPVIAGVKTPVLDQLRPEKDFYPRNNRGKLLLDGLAPAHAAAFAPGAEAQDIRFAAPASGRQFCIESIDAHDGGPSAAIAELLLFGADGKPLNQAAWTIAYADSEEAAVEDGSALNAINGQPSDHWITVQGRRFSPPPPAHPHRLIIDLGREETITGFRYIPRQGPEDAPGRIKNHRIYIGEKLVDPEPGQ